MGNREVIACWGISNVASLNVWEMRSDEAMLVGINDDEPEWCEIEFIPNEESLSDDYETVNVINFHGNIYRLDECMRVR
jgi:hypothetical protein